MAITIRAKIQRFPPIARIQYENPNDGRTRDKQLNKRPRRRVQNESIASPGLETTQRRKTRVSKTETSRNPLESESKE